MIDFNFEYLQPGTLAEAISMYETNQRQNLMYISGATEFISRARMGEVSPDVVIDLKMIPECNVFTEKDGKIFIGAAIPLNHIIDKGNFPLLANICRSIATRTARNKITIGGNIFSHLPYKEAMLAFLLADSEVIIAYDKGMRRKSIHELYPLMDGEFLVQIITDAKKAAAPYQCVKKTKQSNVNYPIVTIASLLIGEKYRYAISGLCEQPFYSDSLENVYQGHSKSKEMKGNLLEDHLPGDVLHDKYAGKDFRMFLAETIFTQMLQDTEGKN